MLFLSPDWIKARLCFCTEGLGFPGNVYFVNENLFLCLQLSLPPKGVVAPRATNLSFFPLALSFFNSNMNTIEQVGHKCTHTWRRIQTCSLAC